MKRFLLALVLPVVVFPLLSWCGTAADHSKENNMDTKDKNNYSNHLKNESSPYLLMHAHNPVDWYPWGEEALEKAKKENKLIIVSIGYAACHWCHVMEHESFSDDGVAALMNKYFVSIKVDREERPDIDQIYMDAAHLLTGSGGWPLNAVALPDGRPVFAGTYFPKDRWIMVLNQIQQVYKDNPKKVVQSADSLTSGIQQSGLVKFDKSTADFDPGFVDQIVESWQYNWDPDWGGEKRAPKFPLPIGYRFLLNYYYLSRGGNHLDAGMGDKGLATVKRTLDRMAMGGIFDQTGGGFARYSTDYHWKVPHFEKMLYDNGQLVSLYAYAYQLTKDPLYKRVVYDTLEFVHRELTSPTAPNGGHGFYSSLDADSEGVEGKFYVWTKKEIESITGKDSQLICDYYGITENGNWEQGNNILFRTEWDEVFAQSKNISVDQLLQIVVRADQKLLAAREKRVRPSLDDKVLTAWNGLMLTGYVDAYRVFADKMFLDRALESAAFIAKNMMSADGRLNRNYKDGKATINGFLDDYAFVIQAFTGLYQVTFDEQWLLMAQKLLNYALAHFYDKESGMFYYTSDLDPALIARKMEVSDNVIPSSNSQMGLNLFVLGEYFYNDDLIKKSRQMLNNVKKDLVRHGPYYANWGLLMTYFTHPPAETAILGDHWETIRKELDQHFLPQMLLMGGNAEGTLPLLEHKLIKGETMIYVCRNKACKLPVSSVLEALEQLK